MRAFLLREDQSRNSIKVLGCPCLSTWGVARNPARETATYLSVGPASFFPSSGSDSLVEVCASSSTHLGVFSPCLASVVTRSFAAATVTGSVLAATVGVAGFLKGSAGGAEGLLASAVAVFAVDGAGVVGGHGLAAAAGLECLGHGFLSVTGASGG